MKSRTPILFALITGILLTCSCKKDSPKVTTTTPPPPPAIPGPFLYLAGSTGTQGICWKLSLSEPSDSIKADTIQNARNISAMVISDSIRYMVGATGGYWKNDSFVAIPGASQLNLITVSGTTVYTAGSDISAGLGIWTNSTESENLDNGLDAIYPSGVSWSFSITGMAVSGSNVLVSGSWVIEGQYGGPDSALYSGFGVLFTNGAAQILPYNNYTLYGGDYYPWTTGVAVSGNDIYVTGALPDTIPTPNGGFWKNNVWNNINNGAFHPTAITTSDTNVVIIGYTYTLPWNPASMQAAYWQNGTLTHLNGTTAVMVALNGSDVYVLGQANNGNIVVWKNGNLFKTLNGVINGSIGCIAIGNQ